jgi:molecular chaperone DnaJ
MATRQRHKRDYYEVLGVDREATDAELKRAFRELARKYHPDINPGDERAEDRFKEANEAYAVLSDARTRSRYDRHGFSAVGGAEGPQSGFGSVVDAFDDIIGDILRRRKQRKRGRDLRYTLELSFEEAAFGCEKTIRIPDPQGAEATGKPREREFSVSIPPGTREGAVKMLRGEGERGKGGAAPGDLHVIVRVVEHPMFRREGHDVWCEVPVSFPQAALGTVVEVPTLDGKVRMRVPEGTQSGRVFRIRGRGIPRSASRGAVRGDQLVRVTVETPTNLSERQRELLEAFAEDGGEGVAHPQKKGFLDKLRELFQD